ncbi:hypothetical protein LRS13_03230 [Svornostia abyssi]|uniref:QsdR TetR regulatory C-terminal domain-containing protein n=1 Tax=Svornostia abyssi TaxID=2898438 RepID=A0ABY5PIT5_9ACTN|nr:hypothetical protein LRS13_03230 [Parviterribacteraceae bacterium J379]
MAKRRTQAARSTTPRSATRADVEQRARELFLAGERIDMQALAAELGIGRATLYRWVGDRDALIASTIWSITGPVLDDLAEQTRRRRGRSRILALLHSIGTDLLTWAPYTAFVLREPATALRILTTPATDLEQRLVSFIESVLVEERDRGTISIPDDISTAMLAYAITRLSESFFFSDVIAGREADVDEALRVISLLLPAPATTGG